MDKETLDKYVKAGRIAAEALAFAKKQVKKGVLVRDVCDAIDNKIIELGGLPAFPAQISMNAIAAHYCPEMDDEIKLEDQLVKIDIGVHVDGCIADCAASIDLSGKHTFLIKAVEEARDNAIRIVKPGVRLSEIGKVIQKTISGYGYAPIKNLSGHALEEYEIHASPSIPNFDTEDNTELTEGMVIAIEPFSTTGTGIVDEGERATIFSLVNPKPVRSQIARQMLKHITENYKTLPFASRWLVQKFGKIANLEMRELIQNGILHGYPPLVERNKGIVAQAEHTIIVLNEPIVTTKE